MPAFTTYIYISSCSLRDHTKNDVWKQMLLSPEYLEFQKKWKISEDGVKIKNKGLTLFYK